ncbi:septum site-determining protein MinC [Denitromonas iodatirespirans]|uniref:Probable septum site-determining protein MinC n=1 Tax=Denitromonas iodatirespirans TaxID=2795389 RepID=A0A944D7D7_DENI1|nr:septum site-determining protein MinC [Denitromonas iodatirespirans]MBT0961410.1 septum site-determining protein MinC [Denitromonas iodatirespirans]
MNPATTASKPIEFRGATLGVMTARLRDTDPMRLADAMHTLLGGMPDFFNREATILDFAELAQLPERIDWPSLASLLRRYRLQPVAVSNLPDAFIEGARKIGLAVLDGDNASVAAPEAPAAAVAPAPAPAPVVETPAPAAIAGAEPTLIIDRPLRSGQQAYARGGDLVLLAGVSHGAEVIADGNIHCYGPLRGRALAGAQGNARARVFSTNFGPELVSIAGVYRTFEKGIPESVAGKAAQAWLKGDDDQQILTIAPLQTQ